MKNRSIVKKFFAIAAAAALTLSLGACSSDEGQTSQPAQDGESQSVESAQVTNDGGATYNVAIIKQMDHASLDEIAEAVETQLDQLARDNKVTIQYHTTSGQNDPTTLKQLADQAIATGRT